MKILTHRGTRRQRRPFLTETKRVYFSFGTTHQAFIKLVTHFTDKSLLREKNSTSTEDWSSWIAFSIEVDNSSTFMFENRNVQTDRQVRSSWNQWNIFQILPSVEKLQSEMSPFHRLWISQSVLLNLESASNLPFSNYAPIDQVCLKMLLPQNMPTICLFLLLKCQIQIIRFFSDKKGEVFQHGRIFQHHYKCFFITFF